MQRRQGMEPNCGAAWVERTERSRCAADRLRRPLQGRLDFLALEGEIEDQKRRSSIVARRQATIADRGCNVLAA
jgi:hypothetical protein